MQRLNRSALLGGIAGVAAALALPRGARAADRPLVALMHTQAAGDNGVVDGMIASLKRIGTERSLTVRTIYASDPANYQPILELLGEAGAAIVLVTFNEMTQPIKAVAPSFPATKFIQLYGDPFVPTIPNVRTVSYDSYLADYLSGMCGAAMSHSGHLAYIGGADLPELNASYNAIIAGAKSVRPASTVSRAIVGSFQDPAKALEIANQMFGGDIDYVQAEAAASDQGTIESANLHPGKIVCAGSRPMFALGPATVVAVTVCDFGVSLYEQTGAALNRGWTGGHYRSDLSDGVIDFVASPFFATHAPPAAAARLQAAWPGIMAAKTRIASGAIKVPFKTLVG
jgi:basic membrane protein A